MDGFFGMYFGARSKKVAVKLIEKDKKYIVSGQMLDLVFKIKTIYDLPIYINDDRQPFPSEHLHYIIGQLIADFNRMEWEEAKEVL